MANTIFDKLARLEQTKQGLYDVLLRKGVAPSYDAAFSVYPGIFRDLKVLKGLDRISGRNLALNITNGSGGLNISNISTSGSEIIVTLDGSGGYSGPGYGGSVNVSGEIVIPFL